MIRALKWDFDEHKYQLYEIPEGWFCPLIQNDMDAKINCASCGKELPFGDAYTSLAIHTHRGIGYMVCAECHQKEVAAKLAAEEE